MSSGLSQALDYVALAHLELEYPLADLIHYFSIKSASPPFLQALSQQSETIPIPASPEPDSSASLPHPTTTLTSSLPSRHHWSSS
jgi:hypothetical protein